MAYSNIKRDKKQTDNVNRLKTLAWRLAMVIIVLSSLYNIMRQFITLKEARERNTKLLQSVQKLTLENKVLTKKIAEATESATIARKQHEYLGMGSPNDYWLTLPEAEPIEKLTPTYNVVNNKPNLVLWWELFVKK